MMLFRAYWGINKQVGSFGEAETAYERHVDFEIEDIDGQPNTVQAKARATREMKKDPRMAYLRDCDKDENPYYTSPRWLAWGERQKGYKDPSISYYHRKTDWDSEGGYNENAPRIEWTGFLTVGWREAK